MLTGGGGLAGIDVADNDDVDVELVVLTVAAESAAVHVQRGRVEGSSRWAMSRPAWSMRRREDVPHGDG